MAQKTLPPPVSALCGLFAFASLALMSLPGTANAADAQAPNSKNPEAQVHYDRANALYMSGAYREAIAELELAVAIDPNAKDLIANLAMVHEKLGDIDDAIAYSQRYQQLDLSPQERARSERALTRLEGAKAEVLAKQAAELEKLKQKESAYGLLPVTGPEVPHRKADALTITAASFATAGLGVGAGFGIAALVNNQAGRGLTSADVQASSLQRTAHEYAVISDVGLGAFGVFAVTSGILYFTRTSPHDSPSWSDHAQVSVAPCLHGGSVRMTVAF